MAWLTCSRHKIRAQYITPIETELCILAELSGNNISKLVHDVLRTYDSVFKIIGQRYELNVNLQKYKSLSVLK